MKNFVNSLIDAVVDVLNNKGYEVEVKPVTKNNNLQLTGLLLKERGVERNVIPTIYIDNFYGDYIDGKPVGKIADEIIRLFQKNVVEKDNTNVIMEHLNNKDCYRLKVVNAMENDLSQYVHRIILDGKLAVVPFIKILFNGDNGVITITKKIFENTNIFGSEEELLETAFRNSKTEFVKESMFSLLNGMFDMDIPLEMADSPAMIVISNKDKCNGAISMLDTDFLQTVSEEYFNGENFIILPSSIHECICVSEQGDISNLKFMVRDINETQVSHEERLSDEIFFYNVTDKKLNIA